MAERIITGNRISEATAYDHLNFRNLIDERIKSAPDKVLYTFVDARTGERKEILPVRFKEDCEAMTAFLCAQGFQRQHIAIIGENSYAWVVAMFAILASDNVLVALDRGLSDDETKELCAFADSGIAFCTESAAKKIADAGMRVFLLEEADRMIAEGKRLLADGHDESRRIALNTEEPAVILFTSGTTGKKKGVVLSQKNLIVNSVLDNENAHFFMDVILLLPFHHCFGLNTANIPHLLSGRTIHLNSGIRYLYRDLANENPEGLLVVPAILENLYATVWKQIRKAGKEAEILKKMEENSRNPSLTREEKRQMFAGELQVLGNRLRTVYTGGAPQNKRIREGLEAFGIEVLEGYGITECAPVITNHPVGSFREGSVGRIIPGIDVRIDNPDKNKEGEICIRGPIVMLGYYKDEEATKKAVTDGWFHTGDLGYLDSDCYLYITGRKSNLIILADGENVSPEELEQALSVHPLIREVVVYEKDGKIAAQIFPDPDEAEQTGTEEIRRVIKEFVSECNLKNPNYKQISVVAFRDIPFLRNASQKIRRDVVK